MARKDLTGEKLVLAFLDDASGKEFEQFFRRLLEEERRLRHVVGTTEVRGPTKFGKPDGGKDSILIVNDAPRLTRDQVEVGPLLTWDDTVETHYSLKGGGSWWSGVSKDVGYSGFLTGLKGQEDTDPKAPTSEALLEHVANGNRYVIVVCQEEGDGAEQLAKVRRALAHHMARVNLKPPPGWEEKIAFLDANVLASFVRAHRPELSRKHAQRLGLEGPQGFVDFDAWTRELSERRMPNFEPDAAREDFFEIVADAQGPRVIHLFGSPGVGKTRLVHRALEGLDRGDEGIFYTASPRQAESMILGTQWLREDAGDAILVVDEAESADVELLSRNFLARAPKHRGARLVLVGVSDEGARAGQFDRNAEKVGVRLEELDSEAARRLVEADLNDPQQVRRVLALAEGYPLFAVLLAEALDGDIDALSTGDDEANRWEAAKRVLAGPRVHYGSENERGAEALRRALCLLVVVLTGERNLTWEKLWQSIDKDLEVLLEGVSTWTLPQIQSAQAVCVERGLLRQIGASNHRYISPANLARMLLNHFFGGGPPDLGSRLSRCDPELQDRAHIAAKRYEVSIGVRKKLSRGLLARFERRHLEQGEDGDNLASHAALYIAAELLPDETARALSASILSYEHEQLTAQRNLRHGLRGLFQELIQAPLSPGAFESVEAALFAMARVEDERWANNATGIWTSLFLVVLSQTHQPWSRRFAVLKRRCRMGSEEERLLALKGLALAVGSDERGLGHEPGRSWPQPERGQALAHKREAWVFLMELCGTESAAVATAAQAVVAAKLRGCIMDGVAIDAPLLQALAKQLERWSVASRRALAETLADIRRYDDEQLDDEIRVGLQELETGLDPTSFAERLVAQVGSWNPGPWPLTHPRREEFEFGVDATLVAEVLAEPALLSSQWSWLRSEAAKRRPLFMRALGRLDEERRFLPELEAQASPPHASRPENQLLPWYLVGWSTVAEDELDTWLARELDGGRCEAVAVFTLSLLKPNDTRVVWLSDHIEGGTANLEALVGFRRHWIREVDVSGALRLIESCLTRAKAVPLGVSLVRELLNTELGTDQRERALGLAGRLVWAAGQQRLSASHEHDWQRLLSALCRFGRAEEAIEGVLGLITGPNSVGVTPLADRSLRAMFKQGLAARVWAQALPRLAGEARDSLLWHLGHARALAWLPVPDVLAWIAEDEERGASAAELVHPYGQELPVLARELLLRFGDQGSSAQALTARVHSTPRAVNSLLDFRRQQLANAEYWANDEAEAVRRWAEGVCEQLRGQIAEDEVHAAFRRKLG